MRIPDLHGATDKLVSARTFHAIDAHVSTTNADCIFGCPGSGWVVFRCYKAMTRIGRRSYWRTEIYVAQAKYQIARFMHNTMNIFNRIQTVDAADEFYVIRAPWRIGTYRMHVLRLRKLC